LERHDAKPLSIKGIEKYNNRNYYNIFTIQTSIANERANDAANTYKSNPITTSVPAVGGLLGVFSLETKRCD